jgi:hypothetical protein
MRGQCAVEKACRLWAFAMQLVEALSAGELHEPAQYCKCLELLLSKLSNQARLAL